MRRHPVAGSVEELLAGASIDHLEHFVELLRTLASCP